MIKLKFPLRDPVLRVNPQYNYVSYNMADAILCDNDLFKRSVDMDDFTSEYSIGYWKQFKDEDVDLPWPTINPELTDEIRMDYLRLLDLAEKDKATAHENYRGWSMCRLCRKANGIGEFEMVIDGVLYTWPDGYRHYIEDHKCDIDYKFYEVLKKKFS